MPQRTPPPPRDEGSGDLPPSGGPAPRGASEGAQGPGHLPDSTSDPGLVGGVDEANEDDDELEAEAEDG